MSNGAASGDYFNLPCKNKYFYMTFQTDDVLDFQVWISGGERGWGYSNVLVGVPGKSGNPAYVWTTTETGMGNIKGIYPFNARLGLKLSSSNTHFIAYDKNGITAGVNGIISAEYSVSKDKLLNEVFSQDNLYFRITNTLPQYVSIKNVQISCMSDDSCSLTQIPAEVKSPELCKRNLDLNCPDIVNTITASKDYPDIVYTNGESLTNGRVFQHRTAKNQLVIPTGLGIFNATFLVNTKSKFQIYLYNQEFYGTSFQLAEIDLQKGDWKLGNYFESQKTEMVFAVKNSKLFFSLDPSGISMGYDGKAVVTLGREKFCMDDLLSKPNLYLYFAALKASTTFTSIKVESISRKCGKVDSPTATKNQNREIGGLETITNAPTDTDTSEPSGTVTVTSTIRKACKDRMIGDANADNLGELSFLDSKKSKDYDSRLPILITCPNNFTFTGSVSTNSDFYIALTDENGIKSPYGFIEIQLGASTKVNTIKKIIKAFIKRSETDKTAENFKRAVTVDFKMTIIGGKISSYLNNQLVAIYQTSNFLITSMILTPLSGVATISEAKTNCG